MELTVENEIEAGFTWGLWLCLVGLSASFLESVCVCVCVYDIAFSRKPKQHKLGVQVAGS